METCIKRRRARSRRLSLGALLPAVCAGLLAAAFAVMNARLREPLLLAARESVTDAASSALNASVAEVMRTADTLSLLSVRELGEDSFAVIADTAGVNGIASAIVSEAQSRLAAGGKKGARVELGSVTGITPLSGRGPAVRVSFTPEGSVTPRIGSGLHSSGVNQSLFSLTLELTCRVQFVLAGRTELVSVKSTVPICETVLMGSVPQVYTNVANEEDMLNLLPTELP